MTMLKSTRAVSRQHSRRFTIGLGTGAVLLGVVFAYVGYTAPNGIPWRSYYTLTAQFTNADNLASHAQVRMGGKLIGQVLDPRIERGRAVVDLQIDPDYGPLRSDTILNVRPRSAIGVRFVEVLPGRTGTPLPDGATIPADQTRTTRALDEVLDTFDPATRRSMRRTLGELGEGLAGRGEDLNDTLRAGPSFVDGLDRVATAINRRDGAPRRLVAGAETIADAALPVRTDIARGFRPGAAALRALRADGALREVLDASPSALTSAATRLAPTRRLVRELGGLAHDALPALRAAPTGLRETTRLLQVGGPSLRAADRTLDLAARAERPAVRLLRTLRPVLPRIDDLSVSPLPILRELAPRRCDLNSMFGNWADSMAYGNEQGNYLRLSVFGNLESVGGQTEAFRLPGTTGNAYPAPCEAGEEGLGR